MEDAGLPVEFAPLSEVADMCFEGILNDTFWITAPSENQQEKIQARATSQIEMTEPDVPVRVEPDGRPPVRTTIRSGTRADGLNASQAFYEAPFLGSGTPGGVPSWYSTSSMR